MYNASFGKFSWAWDNNNAPDSTTRLKDWLDPLNTGAVTLNGRRGCQDTIKLSLPIPTNTTKNFHAVHNIISKQVISNGATATYKAGAEIQLLPGFHAKSGSTFHAKIEALAGCGGTQSVSFLPEGDEHNADYAMENTNSHVSRNLTSYNINIFPNPNPGTFQLETNFPLADIAHLKIINLLGVPVYETQNLASNEIQLANSGAGLYFVVIILKDGTVLTQKMMVQR